MNRIAIVGAAIVTFGIAIAMVILGQNLTLPLPVMRERAGAMPWYITWAMVWVSVLCAVVLGGFLIAATIRKK
jgi:hypothetical protein